MKTYFYTLLLFTGLLPSDALSQQIQLKGQVAENKQPYFFSDVYLIANDTLHTTSDDKGFFNFDLHSKGNYALQIVSFNQIIHEQTLSIEANTDLGVIEVSSAQQLDEVVIETSKKIMQRQADRFVYFVENSTASVGGTALDALKTTPGVTVTQDNIRITGKNSILVLIDDKPTYMDQSDLMHYLESIRSSDLSKIEVITTPPAKYQAEGNSGIINIVTKKIKQNTWNANVGAVYQRSRRNTQQYNAGYNFQKDKITITSALTVGINRNLINWNNDITYKDAFWENKTSSDSKNNNVNARFGLDYRITDKLTVGTKVNIYQSDFKSIEPQLTTLYPSKNGNVDAFLKNDALSNTKPSQQVYNLYGEYQIDSLGKKVTLDLDFVNYNTPTFRQFDYATYNAQHHLLPNTTHAGSNDVSIKIQNFSGKIDVELPTTFANFTTGGRLSSSTSKNLILALKQIETGEFVNDSNLSNYFEYTEQNQALYVSASKEINDKWSLQAGLRAEATQTKGYSKEEKNTHKNDYIKLFPTIYAMYKFSDDMSLGLNYSRRINRPNYESLNPFRTINNEFSYNQGDPFLKPSFANNFELTFTYKTLDTRISYSKVKDGVNQASMLNPDTKQNNYIWMNYVNGETYSIVESYTVKPLKWLTSVNTFDFTYSNSNIAISDKRYSGASASFFTTNEFSLNTNQTLFFSLSYFQNFGETYQNAKLKPYAKFYASVKYLMMDKKLELSVTGNDIFNGLETSTQEMYGVSQEFKNIWNTQRVRFSAVYRFGNKTVKAKDRQSGNTEELNRM